MNTLTVSLHVSLVDLRTLDVWDGEKQEEWVKVGGKFASLAGSLSVPETDGLDLSLQ